MRSITRDGLGPHRVKTILIPSVFFATTLVRLAFGELRKDAAASKGRSLTAMLVQVVDFVVFRLQGNAICNVGEVAIAPESVPEQTFTPLEWGLLELCQACPLHLLRCPV